MSDIPRAAFGLGSTEKSDDESEEQTRSSFNPMFFMSATAPPDTSESASHLNGRGMDLLVCSSTVIEFFFFNYSYDTL